MWVLHTMIGKLLSNRKKVCLPVRFLFSLQPFKSTKPINMENLPANNGNGQSYGYTLYVTTITSGGSLHSGDNVRDRALVSHDWFTAKFNLRLKTLSWLFYFVMSYLKDGRYVFYCWMKKTYHLGLGTLEWITFLLTINYKFWGFRR